MSYPLPPPPLPPYDMIHGVRVAATADAEVYMAPAPGGWCLTPEIRGRVGPVDVLGEGDRWRAERQAWLTRVRDALNRALVKVSACDLSRRSDREIAEAELWARNCIGYRWMPDWLRHFLPAVRGEPTRELRIRARHELRERGLS